MASFSKRVRFWRGARAHLQVLIFSQIIFVITAADSFYYLLLEIIDMSQPSSYNNYHHSRHINPADPLDELVVRPGMEEGESDEDEDMIMFHETSSDILTTLENIFLRYSSASVEPHSYPNHLKKQPLVKLSELGWAHVICCVQNWGSVCW